MIELQLRQPLFGRDIERGDRHLIGAAGRTQAVPLLEALDGGFGLAIESVILEAAGLGSEIAGCAQDAA